ncbi:MAG: DNA recombination protein RmuC [Cyclobacteriaceae bacterium]|jgi:DNA recombination protein RmuC|nr:DNA recombination protein RmuC [Cyclobacteriaceae bacterium]
MEIILLVIGLLAVAAVGWLAGKSRASRETQDVQTELRVHQEKNATLQQQLKDIESKLNDERQRAELLNVSLSTVRADYRNLEQKLEERKQELEELQSKFTRDFENLANRILEEKSKKFTDLNKTTISDLLSPLKEKIAEFQTKVEDTHKESLMRHSALNEQLNNLKELNQQITREASNLTKALKGDSKAQGTWGEFILESILEKSGLKKGDEYLVQESITSEDGKRLQPDVVIKLPDNKNLIIDSKVSLVAYERFVSAETDDERMLQLKLHVQSLRQHIKLLSEKNYQTLYSIGSLDFVLLFVPIEPAFSTAIQHDREIFTDAYDKNIVIVSPSTLIATLRTIASIWKQEHQNRNTLEIARQATALYEKFKGFTDDLVELGVQMQRSQKSYEEAMKKLSTGSGNLVKRVEDFKKLGIKPSKNIDQRLIDKSEEQADLFG